VPWQASSCVFGRARSLRGSVTVAGKKVSPACPVKTDGLFAAKDATIEKENDDEDGKMCER
jgi:hypothetical protein